MSASLNSARSSRSTVSPVLGMTVATAKATRWKSVSLSAVCLTDSYSSCARSRRARRALRAEAEHLGQRVVLFEVVEFLIGPAQLLFVRPGLGREQVLSREQPLLGEVDAEADGPEQDGQQDGGDGRAGHHAEQGAEAEQVTVQQQHQGDGQEQAGPPFLGAQAEDDEAADREDRTCSSANNSPVAYLVRNSRSRLIGLDRYRSIDPPAIKSGKMLAVEINARIERRPLGPETHQEDAEHPLVDEYGRRHRERRAQEGDPLGGYAHQGEDPDDRDGQDEGDPEELLGVELPVRIQTTARASGSSSAPAPGVAPVSEPGRRPDRSRLA